MLCFTVLYYVILDYIMQYYKRNKEINIKKFALKNKIEKK